MRKPKGTSDSESPKRLRPALTPEARENQMISLAIDLAEKQLMEGTASSQVITHYLKLGTTTARLENQLLKAKTKALESAERVEELYANALSAMRRYSGYDGDDVDD